MRGMPKPRHPLSTLTNSTRQLLRHSAAALSNRRLLPAALRKRLNLLERPVATSPPDNRRKKTSPELQAYLAELKASGSRKKVVRDFRELAHYAYVFDPDYYKSQLNREEAQKLNSIGDDAQLANVDLQNWLQKQQQTLQMMSNISKALHDTAMAIIRKIGG